MGHFKELIIEDGMKPKYVIELELGNLSYDLTGYFGRGWIGPESLITEGTTINELYDNAVISTVDPDGGEGPSLELGEAPQELYLSCSILLEEQYLKLLEQENEEHFSSFDQGADSRVLLAWYFTQTAQRSLINSVRQRIENAIYERNGR